MKKGNEGFFFFLPSPPPRLRNSRPCRFFARTTRARATHTHSGRGAAPVMLFSRRRTAGRTARACAATVGGPSLLQTLRRRTSLRAQSIARRVTASRARAGPAEDRYHAPTRPRSARGALAYIPAYAVLCIHYIPRRVYIYIYMRVISIRAATTGRVTLDGPRAYTTYIARGA